MLLIKCFHFSNLKRPNVIKVRCRAEIWITFAAMITCLQFRFKLAFDNCCNYWKEGGLIFCALDAEWSDLGSSPGRRLDVFLVNYHIALACEIVTGDKIASRLFFFVPCNPTSHWKMKLVPGYFPFLKWPNEKALFTVNFSHFHHLTYWIIL